MQVSQSLNSYTLSLFQGAASGATVEPSVGPPGPASRFAPAETTEMTGIYSDPRIGPTPAVAFSETTQRILDTIHSLINNELETIGATFRQMVETDLEFEPEDKLPESTKYTDLTNEQMRGLSEETRDAGLLELKFSIISALATQDAASLKGAGSILFGEKYVEMSTEELVEYQINTLVDGQIGAIKKAVEMSRGEDFITFSEGTRDPTGVVDSMTEEEVEILRSDLLAQRRAEYKRGELDFNINVFASTHAANYDKIHKTLNMATGETVVNEANTVVFDEAWELSARKKASFQRLLIGEGEFFEDNLERLGVYAEEYLRDIAS